MICLLVLLEGILSRANLKNEDIIEGDILWDDHLDEYWESKQKRAAGLPGNNLPSAGAGSQNARNSSQIAGNSSQNAGNSSQNAGTNHMNESVKQAQGSSSTANAWNYKTSDNKGSLTFTIPYEVSAMSE